MTDTTKNPAEPPAEAETPETPQADPVTGQPVPPAVKKAPEEPSAEPPGAAPPPEPPETKRERRTGVKTEGG